MDVVSNLDLSKLADARSVGRLDPEIAGEGQKVINDLGEQISWNPPPTRPAIPDLSQIKKLARYFNRHEHVVYPAWLYHPTEEARLVKNAQEAAILGIQYRRTTENERGKYGIEWTWDWSDDTQWRPKPYKAEKFNPANPGHGKVYVAAENRQSATTELVAAVAAAVAKSLQTNGPGKPAQVDAKEWDEFLQFKAWQKTRETVEAIDEQVPVTEVLPEEANALNPLSHDDELTLWRAEAERKGIKIDKRWGVDRLKAEIEKAA